MKTLLAILLLVVPIVSGLILAAPVRAEPFPFFTDPLAPSPIQTFAITPEDRAFIETSHTPEPAF